MGLVELFAARAGAPFILSPPPAHVPSAQCVVSFQTKTAVFFPQEPTTSPGGPTTSCGGRRPRSSRRPTNLWGTGAIHTCSEPPSAPPLSTCLSIQATDLTVLGPPQALHPTPRGMAPFLEPRPGTLPPVSRVLVCATPRGQVPQLWFEIMLGRSRAAAPHAAGRPRIPIL